MEWNNEVFSIWPHDRTNYEKTVMGYSVKTKRFNYVEWVQLKSGEILAKELYDHKMDPKETRNVIDDPQYSKEIASLELKCTKRKLNTDHDHLFR